jgi:hypothetical protein
VLKLKFQLNDNLCLIVGLFSFHRHSLVLCIGKKETLEKIVEFTRGFLEEYQHEQRFNGDVPDSGPCKPESVESCESQPWAWGSIE